MQPKTILTVLLTIMPLTSLVALAFAASLGKRAEYDREGCHSCILHECPFQCLDPLGKSSCLAACSKPEREDPLVEELS